MQSHIILFFCIMILLLFKKIYILPMNNTELGGQVIEMSYLLCRQCNGYFKLEYNESPHDFESCSCGGPLRYLKSIKEFCQQLRADYENNLVEVDNSVILHDGLKDFKDRINGETYNYDYDDYQVDTDYFEYEYSEDYENTDENLNFQANYENINGTNQDTADLYYEHVEPEYIEYETNSENYKNTPHHFGYENEIQSDYQKYLDNYGQKDSIFSISKNYFKNHTFTILGFSILPLEYYYLFGGIPLTVLASFVMAIPLILFYLPRNIEIKSHEDVKKVFTVWVLYYVMLGIIFLSWLLLTQRQFDVLYIL
jgi:hypothetical protein